MVAVKLRIKMPNKESWFWVDRNFYSVKDTSDFAILLFRPGTEFKIFWGIDNVFSGEVPQSVKS